LNVFAGDTLVAARPVTFADGQIETNIRLTHRPAQPGLESYAFFVTPVEVTVSEPAAEAERVNVQVVDTRSEVLILDDSWRWEFRFLRRVLEDDPSFNFTAFLPRGPGFVQFAEPNRRATLTGFPQGRGDLEAFDLVVLGNVDPRRWPRGLSETLLRAATEDGKSLIVLAGPNLPLLGRAESLNALLPVEVTDESGQPLQGPVAIRPSLEGAASPFLANALTLTGQQQPLPPLDRIYPPLRKRPGATILLETAQAANSYGNLIVMAEHTVGRGRVLFVGADTLWKWQMLVEPNQQGQTPGALFWQQSLRALAPARPPSSAVALWLQPERSRYEAGRTVRVRAETDGDARTATPQLQASVKLPDGRELPLAFAADAGKAGVFQAEFVTSISGRYTVTAAIIDDGQRQAEAITAIESRPPASERPNTPVNLPALQRLASLTGGRVVSPSDPATWPAEKTTSHLTVQKTETLDLWNNFTLALVLCGLFGVDWTLRLLRGFV
ncbi:MAG: hypothetical protein HY646_07410, partial [Acidobacteria bacterium]|nr:hypothetical protein [Acidobacteriota bacterium]